MHSDYHIEDLVAQNENLVVYRVRTPDGTPLAVVRLRYEEDVLARLKGERFTNALQELQTLNHNCLRPVLNGGLDPVDFHPWVAVRWWDGILLTDRINQGPILNQEEFDRIKDHGSNLIETLGPVASTVSFAPSSVVTCGDDPAQLIDTFSVDYHAWFQAFAHDIHPATLSASYQKFADLLEYLRRYTAHTPATLLTSDLTATTHHSTLNHPTTTTALPSATKSSFPKKTLLLATLIIGISASIWSFKLKKEPHLANQAPSATSPQTAAAPPSPQQPTSTPPPTQAASPVSFDRTDRPKNFRFIPIQANDPTSLQTNLGSWVKVSSEITGLDPEGNLILADSPLRALLPPKSGTTSTSAIGNTITAYGFLSSLTLLEIEEPEDIQITFSTKDLYTIKDEDQLRTMKGETVTVKGKIVAQTASGSGSTLYLQLKTKKPEFAFSIYIAAAEEALTQAYLRTLIHKTVTAKGRIKIDTRGSRLALIITRKSQLTVAE